MGHEQLRTLAMVLAGFALAAAVLLWAQVPQCNFFGALGMGAVGWAAIVALVAVAVRTQHDVAKLNGGWQAALMLGGLVVVVVVIDTLAPIVGAALACRMDRW